MSAFFACLRTALGATFLFSLFTLPAAPQSSSAPPPATCTVSGVVVNSVTGEAIRRALVQVQGGSPFQFSVLTDSEGRFRIPNVPESDVIVAVRKPGFFNEQELHPEAFEPSIIHVTNTSDPLTLKLLPEGAIAGRIATTEGEPLEDTPVRIFRQHMVDGRKRWDLTKQVNTDEDGQFRGGGLQPGTYLLAAGPTQVLAARPRRAGAGMNQSAIDSLFFPGVPDLDAATPLTVSAGQQLQADFAVKPELVLKISGTVAGAPLAGASLRVLTYSGDSLSVFMTFDPSTGKFETHVPPGSYILQLRIVNPDGQTFGADLPLTVHSDVDKVILTPAPVLDMPVHVQARHLSTAASDIQRVVSTLEDVATTRVASSSQPVQKVQVTLLSTESRLEPQQLQAGFIGGRTLAVPGILPGRYSVELLPIPPWYVQSAASGPTDVLREDLVVTSGRRPDPLEIVLRDDGAFLHGVVRFDGQPAPGTVLLIPEQTSSAQIRLMRAGRGGEFQFDRLAPGDYKLLAFDSVESLEFRNPEVLSSYLSRAVRVTLEPGQQAATDVERISLGN